MTTTSRPLRPSVTTVLTLLNFTLPASNPWTPPAPGSKHHLPRSLYVGINAFYNFYISDALSCNPFILQETDANPRRFNSVSCAVLDLDAALDVCIVTPECSGVVDRMANSLRRTRTTTRQASAEDYPWEIPFQQLKSWGDFDSSTVWRRPISDIVLISAIFAGTSLPVGYRFDEFPQSLRTPIDILALVICMHILLFLVLMGVYCSIYGPFKTPFADLGPSPGTPNGVPRMPPPGGWTLRTAGDGIEMRRMVAVHSTGTVQDPNLPFYRPPPPPAASTLVV
ncbi:hypothetical protein HDU96_004891 [Phlyctochytrium bullatum]|nr:hypothetical protein HDU96_004891 [Phlyctochytrium bullatum]